MGEPRDGCSAESARERNSEKGWGQEGEAAGWAGSLGPAREGCHLRRSPVGREVPLRMPKHRCDVVKGVFQVRHPCSVVSLRELRLEWGHQGAAD